MLNRWVGYAKARVTSLVRSSDDELDRREARLEAELAEKPWLRSDDEAPSFDDVKARIERESGGADDTGPSSRPPPAAPTPSGPPARPSGEAGFDQAERERAANERLAEIRRSLDLDE
jgi:hypothetical protein